jgi:hypothetical protein
VGKSRGKSGGKSRIEIIVGGTGELYIKYPREKSSSARKIKG